MQTKSYFQAAALSITVLLLSACSQQAAPEEPIRAVKVMTVGQAAAQSGLEFSGEVRPRVESRLGFRVAGKIIERSVEPGQRVKTGQALMQLDAQDYRLAVEAAKAQWNAAVTNRDLAAADLKRYRELRDQNFISGAEIERRETTLKAAQAQVDQAQAQISTQTNQTGYTLLRADADGVVTGIDAEVGQVVSAGTPVVRIARDGPRDVVFAVSEDKFQAVRPGSGAAVQPWGATNSIAATVREVAASADPVTRTFTVKAALPEKENLPLGATVTVRPQGLEHRGANVLKVPTSAIRQDAGKSAVWVLDTASMTVKSVPVEIGTADGNDVVIVAGLQSGMQVVVAGVHVLAPGQKVTLFQPRSTTPGEGSGPSANPGKTVGQ